MARKIQGDETRNKAVSVWLKQAEFDALKKYTSARRWTISQVLRDGLALVLKQDGAYAQSERQENLTRSENCG